MYLKGAWLGAVAMALSLSVGMACGQPVSAKEKRTHTDLYGDPLPRHALARMGTVRLRHGDIVNHVAFSSDSKTVVSCSWDGTLRSWEAVTGKEFHCFEGHRRAVMSFSISKDGKTLASISQDFTIRLWDLSTGKEVHKLKAPRGGYYDISFSPDGQTLASCGQNVTIWETKRYQATHEFELKIQGWLTCLAFSPDGKTLAVGDQHGVIRFWDTANWKEVRKVQAHTKRVHSLAFSPDGRFLASAGEDGLLSLRKPSTGEEIRPLFKGEPRGCSRLAFSPDSKTLAWSWGVDHTVHLFETSTGKENQQFKGLEYNINTVAFSPDGKTIASGGESIVQLWKVGTGEELFPSPIPQKAVSMVRFCPGEETLVTCGWEKEIICWDSSCGKELRRLAARTDWEQCLVSPDGRTLILVDPKGGVYRWDITSGKENHRCQINGEEMPSILSPDGKTLAAVILGQSGRLYDAQTGKEIGRFGMACNAIFLPEGTTLVLHVPGQGLVRWDITKNKAGPWLPGDNVNNRCMAVSPDGKMFASGTAHGHGLHRWNLSTNEQLPSLDVQQESIESLAFSPDGRILASGGHDGTIWLWEMLTGSQRVVLRGHKGPVLSLNFSRDGRRLASGSKDTTALVWDLTDGIATAPPKELAAEQLNDLWRSLAAEDAAKAYRSIWLLASAPKQSLPFLQVRLRPIPAPDSKRLSQLLADLDNEDFKVRTKARNELAKLGETAATALREAAEKPPSVEVGRQVKDLLEKLKNERKTPSAERIRMLRAVEVLEQIGTPEARQILTALASGAAEAQQTQEAKASLLRLAKRTENSR